MIQEFLRDFNGVLGIYYRCQYCKRLYHWQFPDLLTEIKFKKKEETDEQGNS